MMGWSLGPVTGKLIAELLSEKKRASIYRLFLQTVATVKVVRRCRLIRQERDKLVCRVLDRMHLN